MGRLGIVRSGPFDMLRLFCPAGVEEDAQEDHGDAGDLDGGDRFAHEDDCAEDGQHGRAVEERAGRARADALDGELQTCVLLFCR